MYFLADRTSPVPSSQLIDPSVRTLFILEAVGMYIPSSSFSDLLRNLTGEFKKCEVAIYDVVLQGRFGLMMKENLVKAGERYSILFEWPSAEVKGLMTILVG